MEPFLRESDDGRGGSFDITLKHPLRALYNHYYLHWQVCLSAVISYTGSGI